MELLEKGVLKTGLRKLEFAFHKNISEGSAKLYFEYLSTEFDNSGFSDRVEEIIRKERFFPTISVFLDKPLTPMQQAF